MSGVGDILNSLRVAIFAASMDVVTITEFAVINYGGAVLGPAIANIAPAGMARTALLAGVDAATDIAKFILFTTNTAAHPAAAAAP